MQACSEFFCSWWLLYTHSQRRDRKPSLWTLGREKHLIPDNLINSHLSCQSPPGLKDALCHTLLRLLSNQRGVKQESKAREREGAKRKSERKGYLSGVISAFRAPWLFQHIPKASHPSSTLHSAPMGLHFPFPIWSF